MWFYTTDGTERQGPVAAPELQQLVDEGRVGPDDMVWTEGMANWAPLRTRTEFTVATPTAPASTEADQPASAPATPAPPPAPTLSVAPTPTPPPPDTPAADEGLLIPPKLGGWLRFAGVVTIILGALYCLSCFGILWGVLMIIGGVALLGARSTLETIPHVPVALGPFFEKLNTFFMVLGIAYIIMLAMIVLALIFYGGLLIAVFSGMANL